MNSSEEGLIIVQTIDPIETGQELVRIPPHMTVVPWFELKRESISKIINLMDELVVQNGPQLYSAVGKKRALYGVGNDIPVCTLQIATNAAHVALRELVDMLGGNYYFPQFVENWSPHITDEPGISVQPGDKVTFSSLALISRHEEDQRGKYRIVEHSVLLRGSHEITS